MVSSIAIPSDLGSARRSLRRTAVIVAAAAALAVALLGFSRSSFFHIRSIEVVGNTHLSRAEILARSGIEPSTNALWFDEASIAERLEASGWIRDVDVTARLPWTIRVSVKERRPVAVVFRGSGPLLVAGDGTVLGSANEAPGLPRIELPPPWVGVRRSMPLTPPARAVAVLPRRLRSHVDKVVVTATGTIELVLRGGTRAHLGAPTDLKAKASTLRDVLLWAAAAEEPIRRIDVSAPMAPAVAPAS